MAKVDVRCPFCQQTPPVKKHGLGSTVIRTTKIGHFAKHYFLIQSSLG